MLRHSDSSQPAASSWVLSAGLPAGIWAGWHRHPAAERVQDPVSLVGGVQVVVKEPADGLPLLGLGVLARGAHGRVSADEVVEAELLAGARASR